MYNGVAAVLYLTAFLTNAATVHLGLFFESYLGAASVRFLRGRGRAEPPHRSWGDTGTAVASQGCSWSCDRKSLVTTLTPFPSPSLLSAV